MTGGSSSGDSGMGDSGMGDSDLGTMAAAMSWSDSHQSEPHLDRNGPERGLVGGAQDGMASK